MSNIWLRYCRSLLLLIMCTMFIGAGRDRIGFSVLYKFEAAAPNSFTSALGSQPDSRPVLGSGNAVYGMTSAGGSNGTGVIYRFSLQSNQYSLLHTFGALDSNGDNSDGAFPGVALTRGPGDVFYGMATSGGQNGNGTIFKITKSGEFTVLHTFSALGANGNNEDGAAPLRTIVIGQNGLYGTTRLGGENTCGELPVPNGCGVAWMIDYLGNFHVLHQFTPTEGHAASLLQAEDGVFYGCAVWPGTSLPNGQPLPSGILYRMGASGDHFEVLYTFSQTNSNGQNPDGAECYEPLIETKAGVFYGTTTFGGANGNGVVFRFSLSSQDAIEVLHDFSATSNGTNSDGANPFARLTVADDGTMYSTASSGGENGSGVVYRIRPDGEFTVLHTFSALNATTGANLDGAVPDYGVIRKSDNSLIGAAAIGGNGSSAGIGNSGGTLYEIEVGHK